MFKVRGATVYPSEVVRALETSSGVEKAFVTDVGGEVGAAVVCDTAAGTVEQLREAARKLLSSFKVPTVWLLVDSDEAIPRGATGKFDVHRLREMLLVRSASSGSAGV